MPWHEFFTRLALFLFFHFSFFTIGARKSEVSEQLRTILCVFPPFFPLSVLITAPVTFCEESIAYFECMKKINKQTSYSSILVRYVSAENLRIPNSDITIISLMEKKECVVLFWKVLLPFNVIPPLLLGRQDVTGNEYPGNSSPPPLIW